MMRSTIVWAEDDVDDIEIIREVLSNLEDAPEIEFLTDGHSTVARILERVATHKLPGLIVLDSNIPGLNGFQVFLKLTEHGIASRIPVAFFTTSVKALANSPEIQEAQVPLFVKPGTMKEWFEAVHTIVQLSRQESN